MSDRDVNIITYQALADAIVKQAVEDYRLALRGKSKQCGHSPQHVKKECEEFFRSEWFSFLTGVDGELIIEKVKDERRKAWTSPLFNKPTNR